MTYNEFKRSLSGQKLTAKEISLRWAEYKAKAEDVVEKVDKVVNVEVKPRAIVLSFGKGEWRSRVRLPTGEVREFLGEKKWHVLKPALDLLAKIF